MKAGFVNLGKIHNKNIIDEFLYITKKNIVQQNIQDSKESRDKFIDSINDIFTELSKLIDKHIINNNSEHDLFTNNFLLCSIDNLLFDKIINSKNINLLKSILKLSSPVNYLNDIVNNQPFVYNKKIISN